MRFKYFSWMIVVLVLMPALGGCRVPLLGGVSVVVEPRFPYPEVGMTPLAMLNGTTSTATSTATATPTVTPTITQAVTATSTEVATEVPTTEVAPALNEHTIFFNGYRVALQDSCIYHWAAKEINDGKELNAGQMTGIRSYCSGRADFLSGDFDLYHQLRPRSGDDL